MAGALTSECRFFMLVLLFSLLLLQEDFGEASAVPHRGSNGTGLTPFHQPVAAQYLNLSPKKVNSLSPKNLTSSMLKDVSECWLAIKYRTISMKDATGHLPSGVFQYDFVSYGAYDECVSISGAHYCMISAYAFGSTIFNWGVCLPDVCTEPIVDIMLYNTTEFLIAMNLSVIPDYVLEDASAFCAEKLSLSVGATLTIALLSFFGLLVLFATLIDGIDAILASWALYKRSKYSYSLITNLDIEEYADQKVEQFKVDPPSSRLTPFLEAFSLVRNVPRLLSTKASRGTVRCLNGIRTISMMWVVLGHSYDFISYGGITNLEIFEELTKRFSFQIISNGFYSVDSFFYLSGFLVTFGILKLLEGKKFPWIMFYVHRYLRLTPLMMILMLVYVKILPYVNEGPRWFGMQMSTPCNEYWWTNLLYIQNFYPSNGDVDSECMGWTWYLAVDMQLYMVSPFIVYFLHRSRKIGLAVWSFVLIACTAITIYLSYYGKFRADMLDAPRSHMDYAAIIYVKPYTRAQPYLVGMIVAYFYQQHLEGKFRFRMHPLFLALGYLLAAAIAFFCVYGLTSEAGGPGFATHMDQFSDAMYISLSRLGWGLSLGWLTMACATGYGGFVDSILGHPVFMPLSRLTFAAYLIHPVFLNAFYFSFKQPAYFIQFLGIVYYLGMMAMTYGAAVLIVLFLEMPLAKIVSLLVGSKSSASS